MPKRIYFNAFHMNCVVHQAPGLWVRPDQIADKLQEWTQAGVDGFNLAYAVTLDTFEDFVDGVVPVLQQHGLMQTEYQEGTLREKLYGAGHARLSAPHPAAGHQRAQTAPQPETVRRPDRHEEPASVSVAK